MTDEQPEPTQEARDKYGISAKLLRNVVKTLEALDAVSQSGERGDIACDVVGTLRVVTGEADGDYIDANSLIGWLVPVDNWWEFVPAMPPLLWSEKRGRWDAFEVVAAENAAARAS